MISSIGTPPQVALIGVSGYATVYVDWLLDAHKARLVQIVALSVLPAEQELPTTKAFRKLGAVIYDSYEKLFLPEAPHIDLCYIPTGIQWHARMTMAALKAGCNVLVEKPLAGSVADVKRVQATENETSRWVAVGFQDMYTEEIAQLKQSLLDGIVGDVKAVAMLGAWPRPRAYYSRNHWAGKLKADGAQVYDSPLNNAFAHFVNLSLYLAGSDADKSSEVELDDAALYRAHDIESFDTAVVSAHSQDDVRFWFGVSHACQNVIEPKIRITGSKGHVDWSHENLCEIFADGKRVDSWPVPIYAKTRGKMFENVVERLTSDEARICDSSIAICHTRLIEQIHESGPVKRVDPSEIEEATLADSDSTIPAIRDIESKLLSAFETLSPIDEIESITSNV